MKKLLSVLFAVVLLASSILCAVPSVSAEKYSTKWTLASEGEYLTHNDKKYYPIPDLPGSDFRFFYDYAYSGISDIDYLTVYLDYEDTATQSIFGPYSKVYVPTNVDCTCVQVEFGTSYDSFYMVYVEESCVEEYTNLANGIADSYRCSNFYNSSEFSLSAEDMNEWLSGESTTTKAPMLSAYDIGYIEGFDKAGFVSAVCGNFFIDRKNQEVYLLPFGAIDTDVYEYYDLGTYTDVTVYKLEDEKLKNELIEYFYTEPEDDLEWLEPEEEEYTFGIILCCFLFGVLPLLLTAFSIVMLCVIKDKKYHRAYIAMLIGSVLVIIACIAVIILLV